MTDLPAYRTLVVNTVGEPGSGKTTLSFWLSQALKRAGVVTEFVPEVVKYECFDPAGRARVRSGRFDHRYLLQQTRLLLPLLGRVAVVVNDGAFELSYFYGQRRIAQERLADFRERIDGLRERTQACSDAWFVMPQREHPYEPDGRNETEAQAQALREDLRGFLHDQFAVQARQVHHEHDRLVLLDDILAHVRAQTERQPAFAAPPSGRFTASAP